MKRITLEISDTYDEVLTISVIGRDGTTVNVSTAAFAIKNGDCITVSENGNITQSSEP